MARRTLPAAGAAEVVLGALIFLAPLLLGGAPAWALWPTCVLAGGALALAAGSATGQRHSLRVPLAAAVPLGVAAICAAQLLPLPPWLLGWLSPRAAEVRDFALVPLGLSSWRPVSLDPAATWRELAKHLTYAAALVAASEVARSRRARGRLLAMLGLSGALVAATGIAHKVAGTKAVFGLYSFLDAQPPILTPFGNANHLAAFLTLTGAVTLGFTSRSGGPRAGWGLAFVAQGAVAFLSLSRGGVVFFALAQLAFGAALLLRDRPRRALHAAVASACAVAVGAAVAVDRLWAEVAAGGSKTALWPMFARAAGQFWAVGMGRGAFEVGFPRFQTGMPAFTFTHPENGPLQLAAELGIPAAAAVLALLAVVWVRAVSRQDLWTAELAGLCGLLAVGLHDLFDFSLELPPTALAASVLLGVVARAPDAAGETQGAGGGPELRLFGARAAWAAGLCATAVLVALGLGRETAAAAEARLASALAGAKDPAAIREAAREAIDAHPADGLLHALAAQACARARAPAEALAHVNRALFLRPLDGSSHRIAARALLSLGKRDQAFGEYRLAVEAGDAGALREALPRTRTVDELARLCPDDGAVAEDAITQVWLAGRTADAVGLAEAIAGRLTRPGEAAPAWARLVEIQIARSDLEGARRALDALLSLEPEGARPGMARARYLAASGERASAVAALQVEAIREPGNAEVAFLLVELLLGASQPRAARDALERIAPFLSAPPARSRLFAATGRAFEQERMFAKALEAYETASRLQPGSASLHYDVARMHEHHRQVGAAAKEVLAGMKVDSPAGAAAARAWADRLLSEERTLIQQQAARDQKREEQRLHRRMLEAELDESELSP